jgi:hypothetical protein
MGTLPPAADETGRNRARVLALVFTLAMSLDASCAIVAAQLPPARRLVFIAAGGDRVIPIALLAPDGSFESSYFDTGKPKPATVDESGFPEPPVDVPLPEYLPGRALYTDCPGGIRARTTIRSIHLAVERYGDVNHAVVDPWLPDPEAARGCFVTDYPLTGRPYALVPTHDATTDAMAREAIRHHLVVTPGLWDSNWNDFDLPPMQPVMDAIIASCALSRLEPSTGPATTVLATCHHPADEGGYTLMTVLDVDAHGARIAYWQGNVEGDTPEYWDAGGFELLHAVDLDGDGNPEVAYWRNPGSFGFIRFADGAWKSAAAMDPGYFTE